MDKLSSPERLDVAMEITSPKGWIALFTVAGMLAGVLVWSWFGSMPSKVDGQGILISGGTLQEIRATGSGVIQRFDVRVNDLVQVDQVIGEIRQVDSAENVKLAREQFEQAQRESSMSNIEDQGTIAQNNARISSLRGEIGMLRAQISSLETDLRAREDLLKKGMTTAARVEQLRQQIIATRGNISGLSGQIDALNSQNAGITQRIRARQGQVEMAGEKVKSATTVAASTAQIVSNFVGRIIEVKKGQGETIRAGDVVAVIEPPSNTYEPVVYVDSSVGKRVQPGFEAQISPTTVKREEFGFMKAKVKYVSEYPVAADSVIATTANPELAKSLLQGGPKLEVRVELLQNEQTPSGFEWSSFPGPPFKIASGTQVSMSVVVERQKPIQKVLPFLKGMVGVS
jgi:HlyD family secretion protein